ncbi:MAG: ATP synthase F0 subunit B [Proteobacteria bacterium]|nr:ATP synthase F0 subunit B [Pseudomonadota bacterium]
MSLHLPTLVFQVVNFLVLGLVLWRFLWRPLRVHLAARTARIESDLDAAEKGREAARKLEAQARDAHEQARLALETAERKAEAQAEAHRQHLFEQVSREASAERDRIVEKAAHEQAKWEARFLRSLGPAVARVLERILSELGDAAGLHERSCERLAESLVSLPAARRRELRQLAAGRLLELRLAKESLPASLDAALSELFPGLELRRSVKPELLGGAALHLDAHVLDASVRAHLERVLEEASESKPKRVMKA